MECSACGSQWLEARPRERVNHVWSNLWGTRFAAYCTERVDVVEELSGG